MKRLSKSIFHFNILIVLLLSLVGSAMQATPAYAAGIVVNSSADSIAFDGLCTLREAIVAANVDDTYSNCPAGSGADTINFAGNYTITIGSQLPAVTTTMTITGNGAMHTIIQAHANPNTATYRVFEVSAAGNLTLNQVTVRNGRCNGSCPTDTNAGSGIYNEGSLTVTSSVISDNSSSDGGGIFNWTGSTTVINSTLSGNSAGLGGGISNYGTLLVSNSTFSGNSGSFGGGIMNPGGDLTVTNSTFSGNSALADGGAIYNSGTATVKNTILANSPDGGNCDGVITNGGNNLDSDGTCGWGSANGSLSFIDAKLGPLASNGSPTPTFALLGGSPAVDAGRDSNCPATDQRGISRPRGSHCDIGAYEVAFPLTPTFADVPVDYLYYEDIELLYANGLTAGCSTSPLKFCPGDLMNRGQAAVFMMRGTYGSSYTPPGNLVYQFNNENWTPGTWARPWAEAMLATGLTTGCSSSPLLYCPWVILPREQVVIFGLKMKYGNNYSPPAATGTVFADMTDPSYYATPWAEKAYADGLILKCTADPITQKPLFCPNVLVTRGLAAYVIVRAKSLTMP